MRKNHLEHPTQAVACGGAVAFAGPALAAERFRAVPAAEQCKRCARVLAALDAGRPALSGARLVPRSKGGTGA